MATFSAWLREQVDRQDAVGYAARGWRDITPGRISGVTGMIRFVEKTIREAGPDAPQEHVDRLATILRGIRRAADEYGTAEIRDQAEKAGIIPPQAREDAPAVTSQASDWIPLVPPVSALMTPGGSPASGYRATVISAGGGAGVRSDGSQPLAGASQQRAQAEQQPAGPESASASLEAVLKQLTRIEKRVSALYELALHGGIVPPDDGPVMAMWIKRDGSFDFAQLFAMADHSA